MSKYSWSISSRKMKQWVVQSRVFWSFLSLQSSKLDNFCNIGNQAQRATILCSVKELVQPPIIRKITIEFGVKTEQS